jgi:MFS family permease
VPGRFRLLADAAPLRESAAFRRLWAGTTLSSVGSALTAFAVILQIYDLTRSPLAVGAVGVAEMVPTLVVGLLGGPVADVADRRKLVLVTTCGLAATSGALAAQAFAGLRLAWLLYGLVAVQSALGAIDRPARSTFIPSLLPPGQLPAGLTLNRLGFQIMLTAGPALAGLIAAAPHLGLRACYLLDAVTCGAALYGVARLPPMRPRDGPTRPGPRAIAAGVSFIRRSQVIAGAFATDLNATVFGLPTALFPAINAARFGGDPRTLGLFTAAIGVGGLVSAVFSGPVRHVSRLGLVMLGSVAVWGAAFAGFALARSLWLTLTLLAVAGAADTLTVVFRGIIVQTATPDQFRGRVMAADYVVGAGGAQLGNLEAGALASLTSPVISALSGGLVTIAGALVIGLAMPAFIRYRGRPPAGRANDPDAAGEPALPAASEAREVPLPGALGAIHSTGCHLVRARPMSYGSPSRPTHGTTSTWEQRLDALPAEMARGNASEGALDDQQRTSGCPRPGQPAIGRRQGRGAHRGPLRHRYRRPVVSTHRSRPPGPLVRPGRRRPPPRRRVPPVR